jgi:signal transduction histidine kinase
MYKHGSSVEFIAREFNQSIAAIVALVVRLKLFSSKPITVVNKSRTTKADLVSRIADISKLERKKIETLEKANHEALELVLQCLRDSKPVAA